MKKEKLLEKKQEVRKKMVWHLRDVMTDDDLRCFSISQLNKICEIFQRAEDFQEEHSPFFTLSATEVLQKSSGRIAYFYDDAIQEETEEECLRGASRPIYLDYKRKTQE